MTVQFMHTVYCTHYLETLEGMNTVHCMHKGYCKHFLQSVHCMHTVHCRKSFLGYV